MSARLAASIAAGKPASLDEARESVAASTLDFESSQPQPGARASHNIEAATLDVNLVIPQMLSRKDRGGGPCNVGEFDLAASARIGLITRVQACEMARRFAELGDDGAYTCTARLRPLRCDLKCAR